MLNVTLILYKLVCWLFWFAEHTISLLSVAVTLCGSVDAAKAVFTDLVRWIVGL